MGGGVGNVPLNQIFSSHSIYEIQRSLRKSQIISAFPKYVDEHSFTKWYLCLYKFATLKPLTYFRWEAVDKALALLNNDPASTIKGILALQVELSHATFCLLRPSISWDKEDVLSLDRPDRMADFDNIWHPEYQRYSEHAFNHLVQLPLDIIGRGKRRDYRSPTLACRAKLLRDNGFAALAAGYDPVVRNAISHGHTSLEVGEVKYVDGNETRLLAPREFASLFDSLVDTCHAALVAVLLFLCQNQDRVERAGLNSLPLGLRFIFLDAFCSRPGFDLLSMVECSGASSKEQLNIVCKIDSRSRWAQLFEGMHTCWNASLFGGQDYHRFFVAFDCGMSVPACQGFDGDALQRAIGANETLDQCQSRIIVQPSGLWYDASRLQNRLYPWKCLLPLWWRAEKEKGSFDWRAAGSRALSAHYRILETLNRSTEVFRQVEAHIVLQESGAITDQLLQDIVQHATKKLSRHMVRRTDRYGEKGQVGRPDYILIRLYAQQRRIRTLKSYSWEDEDLVLIAEWASLSRREPDYTQDADTLLGPLRIKYNPNTMQAIKRANAS